MREPTREQEAVAWTFAERHESVGVAFHSRLPDTLVAEARDGVRYKTYLITPNGAVSTKEEAR